MKNFIFGMLFLVTAILLASCNSFNSPQLTPTSIPPSINAPTAIASATATFTPTSALMPTSTRTPTAIATRTATSVPPKTATPTQITKVDNCPGAPDISLQLGDWARVSVDPPLPNKIRSQPGSNGEMTGQVGPGENVLVLDGPRCADGYTWWFVRSLDGLEGWTAEGDAEGYWLVEPISEWVQLPEPLTSRGEKTYDLRELSISPDKALVSGISGDYFPLATPLPTPRTIETPQPDDPRFSDFGTSSYAAHSYYEISGPIDGNFIVYDLEDPLSRYYLNHMRDNDCTQALRKNLKSEEINAEALNPFCGINGGIPLHFITSIKPIQFDGGKGVRFLISSANYQTVNKMEYIFQGLSDDKRYFIRGLFRPIAHPYIVDVPLENDFGPLIAWKEGQYDEAQKSYDVFNARMEEMLNGGLVPLYPSLDFLDSMMASIVMK